MGYYTFTGKAYFAKTHIVAGYGEVFISGCGVRWKRESRAFREMKKERVRPVKRIMTGSLWPEIKDIGVTCEHCLERGYPPVLSRQRSSPTAALPPDPGKETDSWTSEPT